MNAILNNINAASGRPDDSALVWAMQVNDDNITDDELSKTPKKFLTLSRDIAAKLQHIASGELGRCITQLVEDWLKIGRSTPGLLVLRTIIRYFATGRAPDALYNLKDLEKIQIRSGNLEGFLNTWFLVLKGMRKEPDIEMMEITFFDAIKDHKALAEDIAHYKRYGEGSIHEDRSYEYLMRCANNSVRIARQEANRIALSRTVGGGSPAAPATQGGKGKGKDKGKGKQQPYQSQGGSKKHLLCRYHQEGKCSQGSKCNYSHSTPENHAIARLIYTSPSPRDS